MLKVFRHTGLQLIDRCGALSCLAQLDAIAQTKTLPVILGRSGEVFERGQNAHGRGVSQSA